MSKRSTNFTPRHPRPGLLGNIALAISMMRDMVNAARVAKGELAEPWRNWTTMPADTPNIDTLIEELRGRVMFASTDEVRALLGHVTDLRAELAAERGRREDAMLQGRIESRYLEAAEKLRDEAMSTLAEEQAAHAETHDRAEAAEARCKELEAKLAQITECLNAVPSPRSRW